MAKYYKVTLFDGVCVNGQKDYEFVGNIIVKKTLIGVTDLLTGYRLGVVPDTCAQSVQVNERIIRNYGHQPFVSENQLVHKNLATPEDIEEYVDGYEESRWKTIHDELKLFTIAQKVVIKTRVKELYKSKKEG